MRWRVCVVLRAFIHKEGLARFCTSKYQQPAESNKAEQFMHLTNYSINKTNTNFRASAKGQENKWTLSRLFAHFQVRLGSMDVRVSYSCARIKG